MRALFRQAGLPGGREAPPTTPQHFNPRGHNAEAETNYTKCLDEKSFNRRFSSVVLHVGPGKRETEKKER